MRVAVIADADQIKLTIRSPYQILTLYTNEQLYKSHILWNATIVGADWGIKINELEFKVFGIRIQPTRSPSIYLNGRKFRGAIDIIRQADKTLVAINHLDIEEYLRGVLYHEVAPWWPMEALKAQAIVARSFALYQTKVNMHKDYDLVSTVYSQVYGGKTSERWRTSRAVASTQGKVLTYQDKIFPTFYHATCAGHTEDASRLWRINLPTLRGRECSFCSRSPHFQWKVKLALKDIAQSLEKAELNPGTIKEINILDRDISGRIIDLEIVSTSGVSAINANRFRLAVGPNSIRSTNFTVRIKRGRAYFTGFGWGHGVGMCQWGAFFMAKQGFNVEQILGYYYPESKIEIVGEDYETF